MGSISLEVFLVINWYNRSDERSKERKYLYSLDPMHMISFILLVVGGLNWLLVGLLGWDVGMLFGGQSAMISRIVYILVGLAAIYELVTHKKNCKECDKPKM